MFQLQKISGKLTWDNLLNLIYPPTCPACGDSLSKGAIGSLCYECWDRLDFCGKAVCCQCAEPIEELEKAKHIPIDPVCFGCMHESPSFDGARSVFFYDEAIKQLIMAFKHGDRTELRFMLAGWLMTRTNDWIDEVDYIIPVPLHYWRLVGRRYNQAMILAELICKHRNIEHKLVSDMLHRKHYTQTMKRMTIRKRYDNLKKAITLNPSWHGKLKGKSVLVIDDVHTSGATFSACAKALRKAGANKIYVASVARVLL